ncbi:hypothetical protein DMC47_35225 [Nostoc sp. 3335mG]|nr:hypothetical protein DMC47_35225 [Nostoc sp. 3335mG]
MIWPTQSLAIIVGEDVVLQRLGKILDRVRFDPLDIVIAGFATLAVGPAVGFLVTADAASMML